MREIGGSGDRGRQFRHLQVSIRVSNETQTRAALANAVGLALGLDSLLGEALERHGPETLLMYFSGAHYRQPMEYDEDRLAEAKKRAEGIRNTARGLIDGPSPPWSGPLTERFFDALANDFNTPRALAVLSEWEREANRSASGTVGRDELREMLDVLGLAGLVTDTPVPVPEEARALLEARERARAAREWAQADRLRDELRGLGWEVRDGPDGPELVPAP